MQGLILNLMIVAFLLPTIDNRAESSFLQEYVKKYPYYLAANAQSSLALVTDRTYYQPGDKISFMAVVTPVQPNAPVGNLYVQLRDMAGKLLSYTRFPVISGQSSGEIMLLNDLPDGVYQLIAFTDAGSRQVFDATSQLCPIVVSGKEPGINAEVIFDKKFYAPSDILAARVVLAQNYNPKKVWFEFRTTSKVIASGEFSPDASDTNGLGLALPDLLNEPLFLRLISHAEKGKATQLFYIPVINGAPECNIVVAGEALTANQDNHIGVIISDAFGIPLAVPYSIYATGNVLLAKGHCNANGKGLATAYIRQSGHITIAIGEDQKYKIVREIPVREAFGALYGGFQSGRLIFFTNPPEAHPMVTNWVLFRNGEIVYASQIKIAASQMVTLPVPAEIFGKMDLLVMDNTGKSLYTRSVYVPAPARTTIALDLLGKQENRKSTEVQILPENTLVKPITGISLTREGNSSSEATFSAINCINVADAVVEVFFGNLILPLLTR